MSTLYVFHMKLVQPLSFACSRESIGQAKEGSPLLRTGKTFHVKRGSDRSSVLIRCDLLASRIVPDLQCMASPCL